jgi:uncharacterized protein (TIGR00255 family)
MTGFGAAQVPGPSIRVDLEIRAVNNRHLKVTVRGTEPYHLLDSEFEKVLRKSLKRGSVSVQIRVERTTSAIDTTLNMPLLSGYVKQLEETLNALRKPELLPSMCAGLLALPGIAPEASGTSVSLVEEEWPMVEKALEAAISKLNRTRQVEGEAMGRELMAQHELIAAKLQTVVAHMPTVMSQYRTRLLDRVRQAVADAGVTIEPEQMIREIALFADRTDVAEEIHRLTAHLEQFAELATQGGDGAGRRLEFLVQEMGREVNTLGSKAGDVTISRQVFDMKAGLEKIRELVQNIE